jgi:histidinol-phosphate aminotransferase
VANFIYVDTGREVGPLYDALLREGVIVRPLAPFGAPEAIRVTVGTADENALFGAALDRTLALVPGP